mgnify:CR=1 FL=1
MARGSQLRIPWQPRTVRMRCCCSPSGSSSASSIGRPWRRCSRRLPRSGCVSRLGCLTPGLWRMRRLRARRGCGCGLWGWGKAEREREGGGAGARQEGAGALASTHRRRLAGKPVKTRRTYAEVQMYCGVVGMGRDGRCQWVGFENRSLVLRALSKRPRI